MSLRGMSEIKVGQLWKHSSFWLFAIVIELNWKDDTMTYLSEEGTGAHKISAFVWQYRRLV